MEDNYLVLLLENFIESHDEELLQMYVCEYQKFGSKLNFSIFLDILFSSLNKVIARLYNDNVGIALSNDNNMLLKALLDLNKVILQQMKKEEKDYEVILKLIDYFWQLDDLTSKHLICNLNEGRTVIYERYKSEALDIIEKINVLKRSV